MVHKSQTSSSCQVSRLWRASLEHLFVQKRHSSHGVRFHWQSVSADGPGLLVLCCPLWSAADFKQQNHKITNLNFLTEAAESQHLLLLCEFKDVFFFLYVPLYKKMRSILPTSVFSIHRSCWIHPEVWAPSEAGKKSSSPTCEAFISRRCIAQKIPLRSTSVYLQRKRNQRRCRPPPLPH